MGEKTLLLGTVASSPAVVTIWDGFKTWLNGRGLPFDYVLYPNHDRQTDDLLAGRIDVAWNGPLAWLQTQRLARAAGMTVEAIATRDTDYDLTSVIVVRAESGIDSPSDLKGRFVGTGAPDGVEATLLPLSHLRSLGVVPGQDFVVRHFDDVLGYHGGHTRAEWDAAAGLMGSEVDACCIAGDHYEQMLRDGTFPTGATKVVARTEPYDHCNMTVNMSIATRQGKSDLVGRFQNLLFEMSYDDPELRPLFDLEYLKQWQPPRATLNHAALERAIEGTAFGPPMIDEAPMLGHPR